MRIAAGNSRGIIRVYLSGSTLLAFREASLKLRSSEPGSHTADELRLYGRVAPDISLTVLVGTTCLSPHELSELEAGDVMVVEKPALRWRQQRVRGTLLVRVGDAAETLLAGEVSENVEHVADPNGAGTTQAVSLRLRISEVRTSPSPPFAERLKMEEEQQTSEEPANGASLIEGVMLTVHVELGARRLRIDELSRLRENQILDLGCNPTDPVDLVVDGRRIARGELVDIEGRLGVRVTQILG
jgi:type III secretion system YscQ/HrcQ family protein